MRHFSFDELELSDLTQAKIEVVGGSRPRLTLQHKRGQRFFLKTYRHNAREIWAEMLASQLGEIANINIQNVSLKKIPKVLTEVFKNNYKNYLPKDWVPVGALVRNVFPKKHDILYGSQIIGTATDPVSLQKIEEAIRSRYLDSEDLLQDFSDMVIFDAWIGNMDRHHENWGIVQQDMPKQLRLFKPSVEERKELKEKRQFSKLFDHGSSLLFELDEGKVTHYLDNDAALTHYIEGKDYALLLGTREEKMNPFKILEQNAEQKTSWRPRIKKSIQKILTADTLKIAQLILQMPTDGDLGYNYNRKRLLFRSLEKRKTCLDSILKKCYGN